MVVVSESTLGNWSEFSRWAPYEKRVVVYQSQLELSAFAGRPIGMPEVKHLTTVSWWERETCEEDQRYFRCHAPWAHVFVLERSQAAGTLDASRSRHLRASLRGRGPCYPHADHEPAARFASIALPDARFIAERGRSGPARRRAMRTARSQWTRSDSR